ncbi:MAG: Jag N-terminal domain-containing protein [Candidatus Cloacimonetes bacterium]|nr:Jag N-terminal domain-containing protein [Candidatus Cloacimonadota bacterium]
MRTILREGKSTSSVITSFMNEFNLKLKDFKFEVIEEGSKGFFNIFGSKPTKIQFTMSGISEKTTEKINEFTEGILKGIDIKYSRINIDHKDNIYLVEIIGAEEPGFVIGKEARLLDSLQHLINQMINKYEKKQIKIRIDVDGYRKRREEALIEKVRSISGKVKKVGKSITIEPLNAANRRIVHKFIEKDKSLRTMTLGEGDFKRVVILPASAVTNKPRKQKSTRS